MRRMIVAVAVILGLIGPASAAPWRDQADDIAMIQDSFRRWELDAVHRDQANQAAELQQLRQQIDHASGRPNLPGLPLGWAR